MNGLTFLLVILVLIGLFIVTLVINAIRIKVKDITIKPEPIETRVSSEEIAEKLSKMIQVETISRKKQGVEPKFAQMREVLEELFPEIFAQCEKEILAGNGLLLRWPGSDSTKKPYMFMSHFDVVPVDGDWTYDPFSGEIVDGKVHGRGTTDTKGTLSVILSSLNYLSTQAFKPARDIYVLSTASEEVSGPDALEALNYFKDRNITLDLIMDEGGAVVEGILPGFNGEMAAVGITEKSKANVQFTAISTGGHASTPPMKSPLGKLGAFMASVEKDSPFDYTITPELKAMFDSLAPYASFKFRFIFGNLWFFGPILTFVMRKIPMMRAMIGTTCAFTMASGSDAFNVLPNEAKVVANMRISHNQGVEGSLKAIEDRAKNFGLIMDVIESDEVRKISSTKTESYRALCQVMNEVYPNVRIAPYVMMATTDCRRFQEVCDTTLRFMPLRLSKEERDRIHSVDEFIRMDSLGKGAEVIIKLIEQA